VIYDSIIDAVGGTPLIRLARLTADLPADIYLKLESANPGGSHKARIALNMILTYEQYGVLSRGSGQTILEPTGGNTGMGIVMAAAVLGYRVVLVIPDNYSRAKQRLLRSFGAEIVLSDSNIGNNSHGELAAEIQAEHPEYVMLNQAFNPANPETHRRTTAIEILEDLGPGPLDWFVAGIGTGGHITGIGQVLKRSHPELTIVAVQPAGCELLHEKFVKHRIQGLAVGMIPPILDVGIIDEMSCVTEEDAIEAMLATMRTEGISVGVSTGANIAVARRIAAGCRPGSRILTIAYDSAADYVDLLEDEDTTSAGDGASASVTVSSRD
jgi:cysteine synthase A